LKSGKIFTNRYISYISSMVLYRMNMVGVIRLPFEKPNYLYGILSTCTCSRIGVSKNILDFTRTRT
jgi:hypothetical protein